MNERIKEFTYLCTNVNDSKGIFQEFDSERFAKLIINEYSDFISKNDLVGTAVVQLAEEHFGIEE